MQIFTVRATRSSIQSSKTRPGADCGSDHELLIAKFRCKLKKVGGITSTFRYKLNQIPWIYFSLPLYNFKGLDLGQVVLPTFFNLNLNLAIRSSWSEPQSAPCLFFFSNYILNLTPSPHHPGQRHHPLFLGLLPTIILPFLLIPAISNPHIVASLILANVNQTM